MTDSQLKVIIFIQVIILCYSFVIIIQSHHSFPDLRMQLLDPEVNPYLVKSLYGLLMLLPQSEAFGTLQRRLDCIPWQKGGMADNAIHSFVKLDPSHLSPKTTDIDFDELLVYFKKKQLLQQNEVRKVRRGNALLPVL